MIGRTVAGVIEKIVSLCGRAGYFLALGTVLLCASVALLRYGWGIGLIWMQELYVVLFAASVALSAAEAYRQNQHVRVDVLATRQSKGQRARLEIFGILFFLFPWLAVVFYAALAGEHSFLRASFAQREASAVEGGLPGVFLVKGLLLILLLLLFLQGVAMLIRSFRDLAKSSRQH